MSTYEESYRRSLNDPEAFWADQSDAIAWIKKPTQILSRDDTSWRWFEGGRLNTAWLCLQRHIDDGRGDQLALVYDSPVTDTTQTFTYQELTDRVSKTAGALEGIGVTKGDRVLLYMPMVPEAIIGMLACAQLGAIHSVVFGGFAANEVAVRIDDARPVAVLTASCGIEFDRVIEYKPLLDAAINIAEHKPRHVVMLQRAIHQEDLGDTLNWDDWEGRAEPVGYTPVDSWDPLYILYTSGTTGKPKGVLRDNGGHAVALHYSMQAVYGMNAGDVFWAASDVGWVVGHSYIVYAPLLKGCTTVLYEGKPVRTPDAGTFWRVIEAHQVNAFFVAPTAFRAIKKEDPNCDLRQKYDITSLRYLFLAGEKLDPPTWHWLQSHIDAPVIDHWWQTETGWAICANMAGYDLHEMKPGSLTFPVPGYDLAIMDETGSIAEPGVEGQVVIKQPLPPGCFPSLWNDRERFQSSYFSRYPGWYLTGDGGYKDEEGYVYVMGRTDDVMNVAGHRLSTGQLEQVIASHAAVAECAVVGLDDAERGQVPVGFVLLKDGVNIPFVELKNELIQLMRTEVGAFANFKQCYVVPRLPKTRSGKILRNVIRKIGNQQSYEIPSTIDDPAILDEIAEVFENAAD